MRITVFGSTGGVGRAVVAQALERGHEVTAFTRDATRVPRDHERIRVVEGAVTDPAKVDEAVAGGGEAGDAAGDAVVSALGPHRGEDPTVITDAFRAIVAAMRRHGVRRFVGLSGAGVTLPGDRRSPAAAALAALLGRFVIRDDVAAKTEQHDLLAASDLEWTLVRPPRIVEGPLTGRYEAGDYRLTMRQNRITYADVAHYVLEEVERPRNIRSAPFVSS